METLRDIDSVVQNVEMDPFMGPPTPARYNRKFKSCPCQHIQPYTVTIPQNCQINLTRRAEALRLTRWATDTSTAEPTNGTPSAGNRLQKFYLTPHASSARLAGSGRSASSTRVAGAGLAVGAGHRSPTTTNRSSLPHLC